MNVRLLAPGFCLALALPWAVLSQTTQSGSQTTPEKAAGSPSGEKKGDRPATPSDSKAYTDASRIMDPIKKIEALEKFKRDYPKSSSFDSANQTLLKTLVTSMSSQTDRIRKQASLTYKQAAKDSRGQVAASIADTLAGGNALLKDARKYAEKGIKAMDREAYIKAQLASYEKRKQKPPSRDDLVKRFSESRASRVAALGRVELALGHDDKARQLLEEARTQLPTNTAVLGSLGELAAKTGDDARAMDLLLTARLSGRTAPTTVAALDSVYRKTHAGSLDGLPAMLDAEYRKRFPNPVKVEEYKPAEKRSDRMVLAEIFTGAGCPPCVAADLAFDAAMERYSRKDLAVVMYHEHVPRPDPMTNPDTQARSAEYGVTGVPTYAIDGKSASGGGGRENAKESFDGRRGIKGDIEKDLETPAEARLNLKASIANGIVSVSAGVEKIAGESKDLKLQVVLVEKELTYSGENGMRFHPMVVRAMGGAKGAGFPIDAAAPASFAEKFDVAKVSEAVRAHLDEYESKGHRGEPFKFVEKLYRIDAAHLAVVAFVQDVKTKHVLQAAYVDLESPAARMVTSK